MNLKSFWTWAAWKKGKEDCNAFKYLPDEINVFKSSTSLSPLVDFVFNNDCPYPIYISDNNGPNFSAEVIGLYPPVWVDAKSMKVAHITCVAPGHSIPAIFEASTGELKSVVINCLRSPITTPDHIAVPEDPGYAEFEVTRLWNNITEIELQFRQDVQELEIYNAYYEMTECCKKCSKDLWHSFCDLLDSFSVPIPHEGLKEKFCGKCPVEGQTCKKHQWMKFCDFYESFNVPFLADEQQHICASDCALNDIRANPGYYNFTFSDFASSETVALPDFRFPFLATGGGYAVNEVVFMDNGLMFTRNKGLTRGLEPVIPNPNLSTFIAPLWANYAGYGEVGGVLSEEGLSVQWTDLEVVGGGRVTVQLSLDAFGNWKLRTGSCSGDTSFLKNAVVGWQGNGGDLYDQIEICDPCNIALDFDFHRRTRYVAHVLAQCFDSEPTVINEFDKNGMGAAMMWYTGCDVEAGQIPAGFVNYRIPQYPTEVAWSLVESSV